MQIGGKLQKALAQIPTTGIDVFDLALILGGNADRVDTVGGRANLSAGNVAGFVEGSGNIHTKAWQAVSGIRIKW